MPELLEFKETIDQIGRAVEELKATQEREISELKKGGVTPETKDALNKLNKRIDDLHDLKASAENLEAKFAAEKKHVDELEKRLGRMSLGTPEAEATQTKLLQRFAAELKSHAAMLSRPLPADPTAEDLKAYQSGFRNFLRKGDRGLAPDEVKAMTAGSDNEGGYLVTPDTSGRIVTRIFETSPLRAVANQITIGTKELEGIYDTDEATSGGWVSETGTRAATAAPTLGKYVIPVHEVFAMPEATQQLLDDSSIDVEAWLAEKVADKLTRVENKSFIDGTGVGQPRGFTTYTMAATADATRTWGQIEYLFTGAAGDFAASNPADKLFDLIQAFKAGYLDNAVFATTREVIAKIRKFKEATTNAYIWQPGLQKGQPEQLLGFNVMKFQDLPALSSNSFSLWLADWKQAYQIVDRQGFRVLRDPYTNKPYIRFYTTRRVGGQVIQFEAIKALKFFTS